MLNRYMQRLVMIGIRWLIRNEDILLQIVYSPDLMLELAASSVTGRPSSLSPNGVPPFRTHIESVEEDHGGLLLRVSMMG
jgi:hypothetical protein